MCATNSAYQEYMTCSITCASGKWKWSDCWEKRQQSLLRHRSKRLFSSVMEAVQLIKIPLLSFCGCPAVQCPTQESGMHLCEEDRRGIEWEELSSCVNELSKQHSSSLLLCLIGREQLDPGTVVSPTHRPLKKRQRQGAVADRTAQDGEELARTSWRPARVTQMLCYKAYLTIPIGFINWSIRKC